MMEVTGLFNSQAEAQQAADGLYSMGYNAENVGYLNRHRDERGEIILDDSYDVDSYESDYDPESHDTAEETGKGMAGGAVGGAATGAGAALLASAGLLAVPGVGPFLAAGTLAGAVAAGAVGAAGGAVIGGAAGAIVGATNDDELDDHQISRTYRDEIDRGGAMLSVMANDGEEAKVADAMRNAGATRVDTYADEGWLD
jgi:hypothetical protein